MTRLRHQLRWFSRLALGLLLALALLPSLSRALADADPAGPWAELCTGAGLQGLMLAGAAPDDPAQAPSAMQGGHCPLCAHVPLAPPPAGPGGVPLLVSATGYPSLFAHAPRPLFAWLAARPRGPPALV